MKKRHFWGKVCFLFVVIYLVGGMFFSEGSYAKKASKKPSGFIQSQEQCVQVITRHMLNLEKSFSIKVSKSMIPHFGSNVTNLIFDRLYENPEIIDVIDDNSVRTTLWDYGTYMLWEIRQGYSMTKKDVQELNAFIARWISLNIHEGMSAEEKVRAIHDFIVNEYRYSYGDSQSYSQGVAGRYSVYSSASLVFGQGGVCQAHASLFYRMTRAAGVPVRYICGNTTVEGASGLHAWNMVQLDGKWYHLDATWDRQAYSNAPEEPMLVRDYYLKGDRSMSESRTWDRQFYPAAYEDYILN